VHILLKSFQRAAFIPTHQARASIQNGESSGCSSLEGVTGGLQSQNGKQYNQIRLSFLHPYVLSELELAKGLEPPTL
jgi:hypothetical protein